MSEEQDKQPAKVRKNPDGTFMKGFSANPAGKPKGTRHFSTLIREAITKVAEDTGTSDDIEIIKALVKKAKSGDTKAIDMVIDRVDGKAEQTINLDGELRTEEGFSSEEKEALLALLK